MNEQLNLQVEFQTLGGQRVGILGYVPTVEERKLRLKLALEELTELAEAYGMVNYFANLCCELDNQIILQDSEDNFNYNAVQALDATVDIAVINNGTIITNGHQEIFDEAYNLIDKNNKTKFHLSFENAKDTVDALTETGLEGFNIEEIKYNHFTFYVVLNSFGKIVKPIDFEPVNLKPLFNNKINTLSLF